MRWLRALGALGTVRLMEIDREQYLTPNEVAMALRLNPETVRKWARTGRVAAVALPGGRWLIHRDVLKLKPTK